MPAENIILGFLGKDLKDIEGWEKIRTYEGLVSSSATTMVTTDGKQLILNESGHFSHYEIVPKFVSIHFLYIVIVDKKNNGLLLKNKKLIPLPGKWISLLKYDKDLFFGISELRRLFQMKLNNFAILVRMVPISNDLKIKAICCGSNHILALTESTGKVFSKGIGSRGQLGHGDFENLDEFREIDCLCIEIIEISCGNWHNHALTVCGDVFSWGWNESGQLGVPCFTSDDCLCEIYGKSSINQEKMIEFLDLKSTMHSSPVVVQFPSKFGEISIKSISSGSRHSVCLDEEGKVFGWGWNEMGQLGDPNNDQSIDYPVLLSQFRNATHIKCHSWATEIHIQS